jgi:F0F1-type ATP synthase epsilon subunit
MDLNEAIINTYMPHVTIISTLKVIFKGQAESIIFPGDMGVFEVMAYHKQIMSRLLKGNIEIDGNLFPIARGIMKVEKNNVTIVIEEL